MIGLPPRMEGHPEQPGLVVARVRLAGDVDEVRGIGAVGRDRADDAALLHHEEAVGVCRRLQDQHRPGEAPVAQSAPQVDPCRGARRRKAGGVRGARIEPVDSTTVRPDGLVWRAAGAAGTKRREERERARELTFSDRHAATIGTPPTGGKRSPRRSRRNTLRREQPEARPRRRTRQPWAGCSSAGALAG